MSSTQCYVRLDLKTPGGVKPGEMFLAFASLEEACCDVYEDIPNAAAEALRNGLDPMGCSYLMRDEHGSLLLEIPFSDLIRAPVPTPKTNLAEEDWTLINAQLRRRSEDALRRFDRASGWMARVTTEASKVGQRTNLTSHAD